jgi:putative membrane protein
LKKLPAQTINILYILLFFIGLIWSGISPHDRFTWILEVFPAIIGFVVLLLTYKKFTFTSLTYTLILIHCFILFIGGHYTYAEVPLFDWLKDLLHQDRNNYDKVGHFAQGFIPAIIVREIFIRKNVIQQKGWLPFLIVCTCITISVLYEFIEWMVAELSGQSAESFLGTQGYIWDTQSDILYAACGSILAIALLSKIHQDQIDQLITHN